MSAKPEEQERLYLRNIKVKGFKSIREMDLDLNPLNVLIGANGSGKSNLLSVFRMVHHMFLEGFEYYVRRFGGTEHFLHFGSKVTNNISVEFLFEDKKGYAFNIKPNIDQLFWFNMEKIIRKSPDDFLPINPAKQTHPDLGPFSIASSLPDFQCGYQGFAKLLVNDFGDWKFYHFEDTSLTAKIKQNCNIHDNKFLRSNSSNLAAYLYLLKNKHLSNYQRIIESIQLVAPFFADFDLSPTPDNEEYILLEWHHKESDEYYNAHNLSDGTLRFICLATLLLQPNLPPLILIDEPELGLHPHAISILAGLIEKASMKTQVIVATQSVTLVNQFKTEDVIIVDREGEESTFRRPDTKAVEEWLKDFEDSEYGLGDLWVKNIFGGTP